MSMKIDLSGKVVLVTGASRGIGEGIAQGLAGAGARVAVHYNHNKKEAEKVSQNIGNQSFIINCDLSDLNQTTGLVDAVIQKAGRLDAVVNNAGIAISVPDTADDETWTSAWLQTMNVNLNSLAIICKQAVAHFKQQQQGHIINISSRAAFRGDTTDYLAYAASKGGIVSLTRSIARYYGKDGVKAFIIAPGFTRTDMAQDFMDQYGEDYALNDIALNQLTEPKDIAPMVALLCSGLADHATGCTIDINAGSYVH